MKRTSVNILALIALVGFLTVLPLEYGIRRQVDETSAETLRGFAERVRDLEERDVLGKEGNPSFFVESLSTPMKIDPANRTFGGTCFFEVWEIDRFLMRKLEASEDIPELYPPLDLTILPRDDGVELRWAHNANNEALIRKLENDPNLQLVYKIYRWTDDEGSAPEVIETFAIQRNTYVDRTVSPLSTRYFYSVGSAFEGRVGTQLTLIESSQSEVQTLRTSDRFGLKIVGGNRDRAELKLTVSRDGTEYSHVFSVEVGDPIGRVLAYSGVGEIDFGTGLTLKRIRTREEEKEIRLRRPVFNADGSRSLDPTTGDPRFLEKTEIKPVLILTIECEEPGGGVREIEET